MVGGNSEVTIKFRPLEGQSSIVLVVRNITQVGVGRGDDVTNKSNVGELLEIEEDIDGIRKTYEVNAALDFKYLTRCQQIAVLEHNKIVSKCN